MIFMWFLSFLGDILVIMYVWVFDLVDLFDEWLYGFYKWYLSMVYLWWKFMGFELYHMIVCKSKFPIAIGFIWN